MYCTVGTDAVRTSKLGLQMFNRFWNNFPVNAISTKINHNIHTWYRKLWQWAGNNNWPHSRTTQMCRHKAHRVQTGLAGTRFIEVWPDELVSFTDTVWLPFINLLHYEPSTNHFSYLFKCRLIKYLSTTLLCYRWLNTIHFITYASFHPWYLLISCLRHN